MSSCFYFIQLEEYYNSYISINLDKLSDNLNNIINLIFNIEDYIYRVCGLSFSEIRMPLTERKKLSTFITVVTKIEYHKFLFFNF